MLSISATRNSRATAAHTRWRRLLTGCLALLAALSLTGCGYGTKLEFNGGEVYYTDAVNETEAQALGNFLTEIGFFDGQRKSVQLNKAGETYQMRFVVKEGVDLNAEVLDGFRTIANAASTDLYNNAPVEVHLTDDSFETKQVVTQ